MVKRLTICLRKSHNFEVIMNCMRYIVPVIVGVSGILIIFFILGGVSDTDVEADVAVEDISQWRLPKAAKARLGKGGINTLAFSPDGTQFAVGSNIGVWLYDMATGKEITMFPGMCQSVAFSPDGRYLANGGGRFRAHTLKVWETATRREVARFDGLYAGRDLRFSSDGKTLIGLNRRGNAINKFDIETGKRSGVTAIEDRSLEQMRGRRGHESYALTDDKIAVGRENGTIGLWDTTTGKKQLILKDEETPMPVPVPLVQDQEFRGGDGHLPLPVDRSRHVLTLAFSADGTRLASGAKDTTVRLWNTTGTEAPIVLQGHQGWINALAFSPDGSMLASGDTDTAVHVWDTTNGTLLATFRGHLSGIVALRFSPDSRTLASGSVDGTVRFWTIETQESLPMHITGHTESVKAVAFSDDGSMLASVAFNGVITLWDLKTLERTDIEIPERRNMLSDAAFSPDGTQLASVSATGRIYFDPGTGESLSTMTHMGQSQVILTDVKTGDQVATLTGAQGGMPRNAQLAFSPDGKRVALGVSGNIRVWNTVITNKGVFLDIPITEDVPVNENGNGELPLGLPLHGLHHLAAEISALVFTPDGKKLISGAMNGQVQMWDAETGVPLAPFLEGDDPASMVDGNRISFRDAITALAYVADKGLLAIGSYRGTRLLGRHRQIGLKEIPRGARQLVFSPDRTVLVATFGSRIELWDLATGDKLATLDGHTALVDTLLFSPDGKTLVSAGRDGTILLWDWNTAREVPEVMDN